MNKAEKEPKNQAAEQVENNIEKEFTQILPDSEKAKIHALLKLVADVTEDIRISRPIRQDYLRRFVAIGRVEGI